MAPKVPVRKAFAGAMLAAILTTTMPAIEQIKPTDANIRGRVIKASLPVADKNSSEARLIVEAIAIVAIIAPQ